MEVLFENSYVLDEQAEKEILFYAYFKRKQMIAFYAFLSVLFIATVILAIIGGGDIFTDVAASAVCAAVFIGILISYRRALKIQAARLSELYGGTVTFKTQVTEDFISMTTSTGDKSSKIGFNAFKEVAQTENFIVLYTNAKLTYFFRKDSFTKGNADDFIEFLCRKGIGI